MEISPWWGSPAQAGGAGGSGKGAGVLITAPLCSERVGCLHSQIVLGTSVPRGYEPFGS